MDRQTNGFIYNQSSNNPFLSRKAKALLNQNRARVLKWNCASQKLLLPFLSSLWHQKHIKLLGRMTEECDRRRRLLSTLQEDQGSSWFLNLHSWSDHIQFHTGSHLVPKDMGLEQDWNFPEPAAGTVLFFCSFVSSKRGAQKLKFCSWLRKIQFNPIHVLEICSSPWG